MSKISAPIRRTYFRCLSLDVNYLSSMEYLRARTRPSGRFKVKDPIGKWSEGPTIFKVEKKGRNSIVPPPKIKRYNDFAEALDVRNKEIP